MNKSKAPRAEKAPKQSENDRLCSVSQAWSEGKVRAEISKKLQEDAGIK